MSGFSSALGGSEPDPQALSNPVPGHNVSFSKGLHVPCPVKSLGTNRRVWNCSCSGDSPLHSALISESIMNGKVLPRCRLRYLNESATFRPVSDANKVRHLWCRNELQPYSFHGSRCALQEKPPGYGIRQPPSTGSKAKGWFSIRRLGCKPGNS